MRTRWLLRHIHKAYLCQKHWLILKHLKALNKYFWKYRVRFVIGMVFVVASNYFAVLAPQVTGYVVNLVQQRLPNAKQVVQKPSHDVLVQWFIDTLKPLQSDFGLLIAICSITILVLALMRGVLMFFMRQTIIVMSRHIEYDQKNEVYRHYQQLDTNFYKTHSTGDLMNRITEDVSRVRMYTGPAIMYLVNLVTLIGFCVINMVRKDAMLTLYVLAPLPILAITIYVVNTIIHNKSERIQALLSDLTTNAQESYSGIRVIKSFVQEKAMLGFFDRNSSEYKKHAVGLAKVESIYFPSMSLMIGLSTLITILLGGMQAISDPSRVGVVVEFVLYINMLIFPVSAIGWVASMIQRASASQKRLNEFLETKSTIAQTEGNITAQVKGDIQFNDVTFTYPHTGIVALKNFSLHIKEGEKVLILGKTGSGKSTIAQLLLRFYDPSSGTITIDKKLLAQYQLKELRQQISYVPQDVFLFSDTVSGNLSFGLKEKGNDDLIRQAARQASVEGEIQQFAKGFDTIIGERGVTLSGGQKQRIAIARSLIKNPQIVVFDDCLSAVDTATENTIISNLYQFLQHKTAIVITHRIFTLFNFDKIVTIEDGRIIEQGTHNELMQQGGYYSELYHTQVTAAQQSTTPILD